MPDQQLFLQGYFSEPTTAGSLGVFDGTYWKVLTPGSNGLILVADSTDSAGVKYWYPNTVKKTTAAAATYTLLDSDGLVWSTRSATGTQAITIPLASSITIPTGFIRVFTIFDAGGNAGTNNITLNRSGSDTINGATSYTINGNYESRQIATDGSTWFLY